MNGCVFALKNNVQRFYYTKNNITEDKTTLETMKAVVLTSLSKVEVLDVPMPSLRDNQVMIKIHTCALCTNDVRDYTGVNQISYPYIGGHEYAGEIVAVGAAVNPDHFPIGARVTATPNSPCHYCYNCRRGNENLCVNSHARTQRGRSFSGAQGLAQYLNVDEADVVFLSDTVPYEWGALCEPMACVLNSIERADIQIGDDVVVLGGGIMGMLHMLFAKLRGARVILSEPDEQRRNTAMKLGCDLVFDPSKGDIVSYIMELTHGIGVQVAVNTTAIAAVAKQATQLIAPMGRAIMYSSLHPNNPIEINAGWVHSKQPVITGAQDGSMRSFTRAANLLNKGLFDPSMLIHHVYDYTQAREAYEVSTDPRTYRAVIQFC